MERTITFDSAIQLAESYGNKPENIELAESKFGVKLVARDGWLSIEGDEEKVALTEKFFETMRGARKQGMRISSSDFCNMLERASNGKIDDVAQVFDSPIVINLKRKSVVPKNINQKKYLKFIKKWIYLMKIHYLWIQNTLKL